jgi:hypothetical protein
VKWVVCNSVSFFEVGDLLDSVRSQKFPQRSVISTDIVTYSKLHSGWFHSSQQRWWKCPYIFHSSLMAWTLYLFFFNRKWYLVYMFFNNIVQQNDFGGMSRTTIHSLISWLGCCFHAFVAAVWPACRFVVHSPVWLYPITWTKRWAEGSSHLVIGSGCSLGAHGTLYFTDTCCCWQEIPASEYSCLKWQITKRCLAARSPLPLYHFPGVAVVNEISWK